MPVIATARCILLAACFGALMLSGCGRRGALDPAPDSGLARTQGKSAAADADESGQAKPHPRNVIPSKEPFILDPLL